MPLYEYKCDACSHRFELIQKFSDPLASACPECGGSVTKLVSLPAFQLKGTGWYATDFAGKPGANKKEESDGDASKKKDSSSESSKTKDSSGSKTSSDSKASTPASSSSSSSSPSESEAKK